MAKKGKDEAPNPNGVTNRDIIQRLNFLYQASVYLSAIPNPVQPVASTSSSDQRVKKTARTKAGRRKFKPVRKVTAGDLAKTYISTMKAVGQKTTVKMFVVTWCLYQTTLAHVTIFSDPAVKRTLCKGCDMTLIPGSTASVRVKSEHPSKSPDGTVFILKLQSPHPMDNVWSIHAMVAKRRVEYQHLQLLNFPFLKPWIRHRWKWMWWSL